MTPPTRRPREGTALLGDEICERDIRSQVEETHHGKMVAIDVDSGDYAIGDTVIDVADRLRDRRPDADVWLLRVGFRAAGSIGGHPLRRAQ